MIAKLRKIAKLAGQVSGPLSDHRFRGRAPEAPLLSSGPPFFHIFGLPSFAFLKPPFLDLLGPSFSVPEVLPFFVSSILLFFLEVGRPFLEQLWLARWLQGLKLFCFVSGMDGRRVRWLRRFIVLIEDMCLLAQVGTWKGPPRSNRLTDMSLPTEHASFERAWPCTLKAYGLYVSSAPRIGASNPCKICPKSGGVFEPDFRAWFLLPR